MPSRFQASKGLRRKLCLISYILESLIQFLSSGGGADGSFLLFPTVEPNFGANIGTDDPVNNLLPFLAKHPVTAGDLIQFAGTVALSNCPVSSSGYCGGLQLTCSFPRVHLVWSSSQVVRMLPAPPLMVSSRLLLTTLRLFSSVSMTRVASVHSRLLRFSLLTAWRAQPRLTQVLSPLRLIP